VLHDPGIPGESERAARRLGASLTRLARVTAELAMADTVETVTKIVTTHTADAVGATLASLTLRESENLLRLVGLAGGREGEAQQWATFPILTRTPASDVIRSGKRLVLTGAAAIAERYPDLPASNRGQRSLVCLPLRVTTRTIGAIGLSFPGLRTMDSTELEFLEIMADTCAQALDRISSMNEVATQTAKLEFLADASAELASSLDYEATLARVARLAVPRFADWCAIDVVEGGRLNRVAVEHVDPAKVELARALQDRYPPDPNAPGGPWGVIRTGRSELIGEITDEMLVTSAVDEEQLDIARDLNLRSAMTVPLVARGKVLGVLTWVSAESERLYGPDDLAFAEDLASRAALAIDNAELHSQTLAAAVQLQRAVLPDAMPALADWEVANYYSPSGRTDVGGDFYDAVPIGEDRLAVFVGDVMGRGVAAAASMAQMRAAVRAYTAVDPTPEVVMRNLDLMFAQYGSEQLVTLVYLVLDPRQNELVVANAGHPPPVILRSTLNTEQLPLADGAPLGTLPQHRQQIRLPFGAGDTLLAFTDGLIERRDEDIDRGLDRVHHALPVLARSDLSAALTDLVHLLREPSQDDDVAALVVRRAT
jgi:GAF domain-containing protein